MKMNHTGDPAKEIHTKLGGAHNDYRVCGVDVLLAIYQRPEKSAGGIILTDNVKGEDLYQGKVGLVLKVGPLVNDKNKDLYQWFGGKLPKEGDWVVVRVGDTYAFDMTSGSSVRDKVPCRTVEARQIRGIASHPDLVW